MTHQPVSKKPTTRLAASPSLQQTRLLDDGTEPTIDDLLAEVRAQLGMTTAPLMYERCEVAIAHIRIPHEQRMRGVNRYTRNITVAGVLHDPAVVAIPGTEDFEAIFGRHRISGIAAAGAETIWVRVYKHLNPKVKAFLRLSEGRRRTTNWVDELEHVIDVLDEGCGLSEKTISWSLGVPITTLRFYFKIAKLPFMVRERILAGDVTVTTARRILRLSHEQLQMVDAAAVTDQPLDALFVKHLLHQRVSAGMQQVPFGEEWATPTADVSSPVATDIAQRLMQLLDTFLPDLENVTIGNSAQVRVSGRIFAHQLTALLRASTVVQERDSI